MVSDFDFRDLRTVQQIVDESRVDGGEPTIRPGTLRDWIFYGSNGFDKCVVRVGRRVYIHRPSLNAWLARCLGRSA